MKRHFDSDMDSDQLQSIHYNMVLSRLLDERLISIYKKGQGYFWVGAPGEEGFDVPLGLLVKKGQGLSSDWLYLHYRCTGTVLALGLKTKDAIRMMMSKKTDPFTGGRNFIHHYASVEWNLPPITSIVEMQYSIAIGTARAQAQESKEGITIVTGGEAGTAMADFHTALLWSSRPKEPLPLLMIVLNNGWGISTPHSSQQKRGLIQARARAFGIKTFEVDGTDPIKSFHVLREALDFVRNKRKPALIEAHVSRLYGHSSADGAHIRKEEICPLKKFEAYLTDKKIISSQKIKNIHESLFEKLKTETKEVLSEAEPDPQSVWDFVWKGEQPPDWRLF